MYCLHGVKKGFVARRLGHVTVGAQFIGDLDVRLGVRSGEDNDRNGLQFWVALDLFQAFVPAHARHIEVEKDHRRLRGLGERRTAFQEGDGILAIPHGVQIDGFVDFIESDLDKLGIGRIVFNEQDMNRREVHTSVSAGEGRVGKLPNDYRIYHFLEVGQTKGNRWLIIRYITKMTGGAVEGQNERGLLRECLRVRVGGFRQGEPEPGAEAGSVFHANHAAVELDKRFGNGET